MFGRKKKITAKPLYVVVTLNEGKGFYSRVDAQSHLNKLTDEFRGLYETYTQHISHNTKTDRLNVRGLTVYGNEFNEKNHLLKQFAKAVANSEGDTWLKTYKKNKEKSLQEELPCT